MNTKTLLTLVVALAGFAINATSMAADIGQSPDARPDTSGSFKPTLTRVQVRDATTLAVQNGWVPAGENSVVPSVQQGPVKTRAQVRAETREAARLGLTFAGEVLPVATAAQLSSIEMAGLRALDRGNAAE